MLALSSNLLSLTYIVTETRSFFPFLFNCSSPPSTVAFLHFLFASSLSSSTLIFRFLFLFFFFFLYYSLDKVSRPSDFIFLFVYFLPRSSLLFLRFSTVNLFPYNTPPDLFPYLFTLFSSSSSCFFPFSFSPLSIVVIRFYLFSFSASIFFSSTFSTNPATYYLNST